MDLDDKVYGITENGRYRIGASDLINHPKPTELERINTIKAEKVYKQQNREPLGHIPDRGYVLPEKYTVGKCLPWCFLSAHHRSLSYFILVLLTFYAPGQQAFGIKSASSLEPAKGLIFPSNIDETVAGADLYKRSHGSYAPGEQRRRGYDWNINPETTRFGAKGDTIAFNGVSKNIADVLNGSANVKNNTVVNTKKVEDFRNMADVLGQSKNLGQDSGSRPKDMVYGRASGIKGLSAAEVLRGKYNESDNLPDRDLGKSITPGFRNLSYNDRVYGCPSIRNDIPAPQVQRRSIADSQNYGDDVPAQDLINPPAFSDLAIGPMAMSEPRNRDSMLQLFSRIGYSFSEELGSHLFYTASEGREYTTINAFRNVLNDFLISQDLKK